MIARIGRLLSLQAVALLAGFLATNGAYAQWRYDPQMQAVLPPYCRNAQIYRDQVPGGNDPAEIERWNKAMGADNFLHIHHYCFGLESTNRALFRAQTRQDREHALRYSITEFDYVITRATADFVLLPEILTKRGENLLRLGRAPEAVLTLERAVESKADYWPPYAALGDYYKQAGKTEEAREWLEKGLAASPRAAPLERRLRELPRGSTARRP